MQDPEIKNLIVRKLAGDISELELAQLERWLEASPENMQLYESMERVWQVTRSPESPPAQDVAAAWTKLQGRIRSEQDPVAAHVLHMPDRSPPSWQRNPIWRVAAAAVVVLAVGLGVWQSYRVPSQQIVQAGNAETRSLMLPDGSEVRLNSGSELRFATIFGDTIRRVMLEGEAFFTVQRSGIPFEVRTDNARIRVLGTEFNVWARDQETRVIVREGRVALISSGQTQELGANEMSLSLGTAPPPAAQTVDAAELLGWLDGRLVFVRAPLAEVAASLERRYDIPVRVESDSLAATTLTGSFASQPLAQVLHTISITLGVSVEQHNTGWLLREKSR